MVGLDHVPASAAEERSPELQARHARWGLALFGVYCVLYATFMGLVAFAPARWLAASVWTGMNLALVYGLSLIAAAVVLAFCYGWLCRASRTANSSQAVNSSREQP